MEEILKGLKGKEIDINCGGTAVFRGKVKECSDGILRLSIADQREVFIAVEKVAAVSEVDLAGSRPGFIV